MDYRYGLGELIEAETVFVRFVDEGEDISIKTSKPAVISRLFLDDGEQISASGQNICEITELDHYDYRQHQFAFSADTSPCSPQTRRESD